jgi:hypothetical protein
MCATPSFRLVLGACAQANWAACHAAAHLSMQAQIAAILRGRVGGCPCTALVRQPHFAS